MGFWEGKCFNCIVIGTLIAIISLSIGTTVKENKKQKRIEKYKTQYQDSL